MWEAPSSSWSHTHAACFVLNIWWDHLVLSIMKAQWTHAVYQKCSLPTPTPLPQAVPIYSTKKGYHPLHKPNQMRPWSPKMPSKQRSKLILFNIKCTKTGDPLRKHFKSIVQNRHLKKKSMCRAMQESQAVSNFMAHLSKLRPNYILHINSLKKPAAVNNHVNTRLIFVVLQLLTAQFRV